VARPSGRAGDKTLLDQTGKPFRQDELFDHWVRNCRQFEKIRDYIHSNPVHGLKAVPPQEQNRDSNK
jgi:hypothetical protein